MRTMLGVLAFMVLLAGQSLVSEAGPKGGKVDIRGTIKTFKKSEGKILATMLVEGKNDKDTSYDKALVKVTAATKLVRIGAKDRRAATIEDLKVGTRVEINFTGPVAESYPVQATAGEIRIFVEEKK